jgi:hypothetical protein
MLKWSLILLTLLVTLAIAGPAAQGEEDPVYSGFIKKGGLTGNLDKLMNVNLFVAGRVSRLDNDGLNGVYGWDDRDNVGIPGARLYLTGQVYTDLFYKVAYEFSSQNDLNPLDRNGRLTDAMLTWRLPLVTDMINRIDFNVGLGPVFFSPSGEVDIFFQDTIAAPLLVQTILPPGGARDTGMFVKGSFLDRDIVQLWAGFYNGAHRTIQTIGAVAPVSQAVDAWGTSPGTDMDQFAYMGRAQVKILDEEDYFLTTSGGVSVNSVLDELQVGGRRINDVIFSGAGEFRFNERLTWVKGEILRTRTKHFSDMYGFHVTAGHRLTFLPIKNIEVVARYERQKLDDHRSSADDLWAATAGINYFFDPEHQHDGKFQINYVVKSSSTTDLAQNLHRDQSLVFQFVIGF